MTTGDIRECEETTHHAQVEGRNSCWCGFRSYAPFTIEAKQDDTRARVDAPTRFNVGDRVKNNKMAYYPPATVTETTERGFKYKFDYPWVLSPRLGSSVGGESYDDSQWELEASDAYGSGSAKRRDEQNDQGK